MKQANLFDEARRLAQEGAQQAADHADRTSADWTGRAISAALKVANRGKPFLFGDVRAEAERDGLPRPPDNRSWGHIARSLAMRDLIRPTGRYEATSDPVCHNRPQRQWIKA